MGTETSNIRVLVAEDDPSVMSDYLAALSHSAVGETSGLDALERDLFGATEDADEESEVQFDVVPCFQGEDALTAYAEATHSGRSFDVALIDVRMPPGIDGVETASRLRASDPRLLIGIVTGYSDVKLEDVARRILPRDRLFFVRKPFICQEIRETVMRELERTAF